MKVRKAAASTIPLTATPQGGTWYRAIPTRYAGFSLHSKHTTSVRSRFSKGTGSKPPYELLYLAEDPVAALLEVQALFGSIWIPGGTVAHPRVSVSIVSVTVNLAAVTDLTSGAAQKALDTNEQEMTGDWQGFHLRALPGVSVSRPGSSSAPTQDLGEVLHQCYGVNGHPLHHLEGFLAISARVPYARNLVVFPKHLQPGSSLVASDGDTVKP